MTLLQVPEFCTDGAGFTDYLGDFEFINAFTCTASELGGGFATVATLIMGGVALSIYIRTGSVALPAVLVLLTGGGILSLLAPPAITLAAILVLLFGAVVLTLAYYRYAQ